MKIVITHTDFRLYWPARLATFSKLAHEKGHSLLVIEIAGKGSPYSFAGAAEVPSDLDWICLFPGRKMEAISGQEASAALFNKLEELRPDVVLAGAIAFPSGATAVRWCRARNKRVVIFDNARLLDVPRSWLVNFIKRRIYSTVDAVLCPAPSHTEAFQFWGAPLERIFFGINVVDNQYFSEQAACFQKQKEEIRKKLELPPLFFLGVGRFVDKKNWDDVLLAYAQARREMGASAPALVFIGDGPEKEHLLQIVKREQIEGVIFRPFCQQDELCKYYTLADLLILASSGGETWGLVVNEAMACGLPVLVSRQCGCAATLVAEGKNGFTFNAGDQQGLAQKMVRYCLLPEQAKHQMGIQSREIISQWSLDRFSQGAWQAVEYARMHPVTRESFLDSLIIALWKGRYRPT